MKDVIMKNLILTIFLVIANVDVMYAQNSTSTTTEQEIINLSKQKWQWMADKKSDELAELFDAKSMFVHMGGAWGKEQELNIIKSGGIWYKKQTSTMFL